MIIKLLLFHKIRIKLNQIKWRLMLHWFQQYSLAAWAVSLFIFNGNTFIKLECRWKYSRMCHHILPRVTHTTETCNHVWVCNGVLSFVLGKKKRKKGNNTFKSSREAVPHCAIGDYKASVHENNLARENHFWMSTNINSHHLNILDTGPESVRYSHPLCGCPGVDKPAFVRVIHRAFPTQTWHFLETAWQTLNETRENMCFIHFERKNTRGFPTRNTIN